MKEKQEIIIGGLYYARYCGIEVIVIGKDYDRVETYALNNSTGLAIDAETFYNEFRYAGLYKKHNLWQKLKFCWKFIMSKRG